VTNRKRGCIYTAYCTSTICTSRGGRTRRSIWGIAAEGENQDLGMFFHWCWWSNPFVLLAMSVQRHQLSTTILEGGNFPFKEKRSSANSAHRSHHKLFICRSLKLLQMASSYSKTVEPALYTFLG